MSDKINKGLALGNIALGGGILGVVLSEQDETAALFEQYQQSSQKNVELLDELHERDQKNAELLDELNEKDQKNTELINELHERDQKITELEKRTDVEIDQSLFEQYQEVSLDNTKLLDRIHENEEEIRNLKKQLEECKKGASCNSKFTHTLSRIGELEKMLETANNTLKEQQTSSRSYKNTVEETINKQKKEIANLNQELKKSQEDLQRLQQSSLDELNKLEDRSRQENEQFMNIIEELRRENITMSGLWHEEEKGFNQHHWENEMLKAMLKEKARFIEMLRQHGTVYLPIYGQSNIPSCWFDLPKYIKNPHASVNECTDEQIKTLLATIKDSDISSQASSNSRSNPVRD